MASVLREKYGNSYPIPKMRVPKIMSYLVGPFFGLTQSLAPLRARALATAFIFFIFTGFGNGLGPLFVGSVSNMLTEAEGSARALQYALSIIPVISVIAGLVVLMRCKGIADDLTAQGLKLQDKL